MEFKRWVVVGFVAALMVFSFLHLTSAGSDYQILTTSDSGFFYGIAREINEMDGLLEVYELSHPPQGLNVLRSHQFQPILLVMFYRGLHSIDSSISLMNACQYFGPFIFALALIGVFLAGRELGDNLTGGASAFLMSALVGSIYWTKLGAFDREITLIFFGAWTFYFIVKLFNAARQDVWKYSVLAGLVYGLFLITWPGALFMAPIPILGLILVLLFGLPSHYTSADKIEDAFSSDVREHLHLIGGLAVMFAVTTLFVIIMGGYSYNFWIGFAQRTGSFLGLGGVGLKSPTWATEMPPPTDYWGSLNLQLFRNMLLMKVTIIFASFAILKVFWTRKKHEFLLIPWLIVPGAMATSQARFFRIFWPMWPILAGYGAWALVWMVRHLMESPALMSSRWLDRFRQPIVFALVAIAFITPFVYNVRANATDTQPNPHGGTLPQVYHSLVESYDWIRNNTPENSVIAVEWSYGHLLTGMTDRKSVTDGAETTGIWENRELPPPDYAKLDINGDGKITEADDTDGDGDWEIEGGRRQDIQRLYNVSDDGFERTIRTYRDDYGLKIDYVVFNLIRTDSALASLWNPTSLATSVEQDNQRNLIFRFEEENIVRDQQWQVYTQDEGESLGGVIYYHVKDRLFLYRFNQAPDIQKILLVRIGVEGRPAGALADFEGIPMVICVRGGYEMPDYMKRVYSSPTGYAVVYKICHVPDLISPESGAKISDDAPTFEWSSTIGGEKYELVLGKNPDVSSPEFLENLSTTSFTLSNPLSDDGYYWRVRAFNEDNDTTGWSPIRSFTIDTTALSAPTLSSPSDNSTLSDNTPTFQWDEVSDAESYALWADNDSDFSSPEIQTTTSENSYTPGEALAADNYWWQVRAIDAAGGKSDWSETWSFTQQI